MQCSRRVKRSFLYMTFLFLLFKLLLCGTGEYSIADFKSNHIVNGGSPEFRRVLGKKCD
jgi:hypothetical protein